jgi:hypothetical protein
METMPLTGSRFQSIFVCSVGIAHIATERWQPLCTSTVILDGQSRKKRETDSNLSPFSVIF